MKRIEELLGEARRIVILGHVHPDGDCVGSCLGLWNYLRDTMPEREVRVFLEPFSPAFMFLRGAEQVSGDFPESGEADLCVCLDASDEERLGGGRALFAAAKRTVCIDHHITNTGYAQENVIEGESSSASEVLTHLLDPERISRETAECLYLGIVHDTGVFKHSNTSEETMRTAGFLLAKGVSSAKIIDDTFYKKTYVQNRILGAALLKSRLFLSGRMIASVLSMADMREQGAGCGDLDGIIDQLRVTEGVKAAALLYETAPGEYKISLRSNEPVDVSVIAALYGGGGHVRAAGGCTQEEPWSVIGRIAERVGEQLGGAAE